MSAGVNRCFLWLQEKKALLPPEPSGNAEPVVTCLFRMPDGTRASRRFLQNQNAQVLFHFADSRGAGGLSFGSYQLVTQFPRRVITAADTDDKSLAELGISGQEVLLLERLATAQS